MRLKVMNYYPAQGGWSYMWTRWRPMTLDDDFARIKALHANTVRIIIQADAFGYPVAPTRHVRPAVLGATPRPPAWPARPTDAVRPLVAVWGRRREPRAGRTRCSRPMPVIREIAFVELRNEINTTDTQALAWARALIPYVRAVDGGIPLTLSTAGAAGLSGLQALVTATRSTPLDFYTLHYYGYAEMAYAAFAQARQVVAPAPLLIGEAGFSTCLCSAVTGLPTTQAALEAYQDHYYRTVAFAAHALGLPAPAPWIFSDFSPGAMPQASKANDYDFGLYRRDNSLKPAAASVRAFFGGAISLSFNNGFEAGVDTPLGPMPAEWRVDRATEARFALDTQVAHTGHASALISSSGGDNQAVPAFYSAPISPQVVPGQVYAAAAWARGLNATGSTRVALSWFSASGAYVGQTESMPLAAGTTSWTYLVAQGAAPVSAAYVLIYLKSSDNSGTAWFDDVSFTPCRACEPPGSNS